METLRLEARGRGFCGNTLIRRQLDAFVGENFELLYFGAVRRGENIPEDPYAPRRIQTNDTRLHADFGLKIADGHHYKDEAEPTDKQLRSAIDDIQLLLNAAAEERPATFKLVIEKLDTPSPTQTLEA